MNKYYLLFYSLVLAIIGGGFSAWVQMNLENRRNEQAAFRIRCYSKTDPYWKEFQKWQELPIEQRWQQPWGESFGKTSSEAEFRQRQQEKLLADVDNLIQGDEDLTLFADAVYGPDWNVRLEQYLKEQQKLQNYQRTGLIALALGGSMTFITLIAIMASLVKKSRRQHRQETSPVVKTPALPAAYPLDKSVVPSAESARSDMKVVLCKDALKELWTDEQAMTGFLQPKGKQAPATTKKTSTISPLNRKETAPDSLFPKTNLPGPNADSTESPKTLTTDKKADYVQNSAANSVDSNKEKTRDDSLTRLTQEISALREYAASQQSRVKKLQDGYDWTILKNFCLRFIRCIDNLENRIRYFQGEGEDTTTLEDIRDELVFALESSGVEQFQPEESSEYRGQEKHLEVLRDRKPCDDPRLAGKVAEVIRPGYQYVVSDSNIKIVRNAQVRLFETEVTEIVA